MLLRIRLANGQTCDVGLLASLAPPDSIELAQRDATGWRRHSLFWAAGLLHSGDTLRKPCAIPRLGFVPFKVRPEIVARFVAVIAKLTEMTEIYFV